MSLITIETIEAKQTELGALIQKFKEQSQVKVIKIEGRTIELRPGECYAGAKLDEHGNHLHDVIVLAARSEESYTFDGAQQWAKAAGGDAPSPEECALIKANCPGLITRWTWTNKTHEENASYAWCFTSNGTAGRPKSAEGGALAVRRS
ncbi:hypothetical protein [Rhodoferax sp. GW822-FHT02A01]|uniref:hypothetical protein n=1 Tax=Rhodoferax sp. GW822-FHT02A01 TaxID=3141537 RepID=UPI00315CD6C1